MADKTAEPKRWVLIKMLHAAVERTAAEIEELQAHGLFVRDASGPDDTHPEPSPPAVPPPAGTATSPPPGGNPSDKEKP
jgi:hypothetical protein